MDDAQQPVQELLLDLIKRYYDPRGVDQSTAGPCGNRRAERRSDGYSLKNTTCGDVVTVFSAAESGGALQLHVQGCAVCKASAALVEQVSSCVAPEQLADVCDTIVSCISGELPSTNESTFPREISEALRNDLLLMCRIREIPGRRRCATLSWEAAGAVLRSQMDESHIDEPSAR